MNSMPRWDMAGQDSENNLLEERERKEGGLPSGQDAFFCRYRKIRAHKKSKKEV